MIQAKGALGSDSRLTGLCNSLMKARLVPVVRPDAEDLHSFRQLLANAVIAAYRLAHRESATKPNSLTHVMGLKQSRLTGGAV